MHVESLACGMKCIALSANNRYSTTQPCSLLHRMDKKKKECSVCQKAGCSYKCPKCFSPYCSAGCWSTHKTTCPALQTDELAKPSDDSTKKKPEDKSAKDEKKIAQTDIVILQPGEKAGLIRSTELRSLLKSKRLRDDISCIDSSKDRQAALKAMRAKNPEFGAFVDILLDSVNK